MRYTGNEILGPELQRSHRMGDIDKYKPAVATPLLLFLAALVWDCAGIMLLLLAFSWLSTATRVEAYLYAGAGILLALLVHHFGFLKIVDKNLERILQMNGKKCLFAFIPWKSYLIVAVMIAMGAGLRHSPVTVTTLPGPPVLIDW